MNDLIDFIKHKDLVKIMGDIFEVQEICGVKMVLSYENGCKLNDIISYVNQIYRLDKKGDYIKVWEVEEND